MGEGVGTKHLQARKRVARGMELAQSSGPLGQMPAMGNWPCSERSESLSFPELRGSFLTCEGFLAAAGRWHHLANPALSLGSPSEFCVISAFPSFPLLLCWGSLTGSLLGILGKSCASGRAQFQMVVFESVCASRPADSDLFSGFLTLGTSDKKGSLCNSFGY